MKNPKITPKVGAAPRIILLILLLLVLFSGGLLWFDYLGILNIRDRFGPVLNFLGLERRPALEAGADPLLLEGERLAKLEEALEIRAQNLDEREQALQQQEENFQQKLGELEELEESLNERISTFEARLETYNDERANLQRISADLVGMRPEEAVEILSGYDDQLLIDVLRVTEEVAEEAGELSMVSVWLSRMDPVRVAEIQRKMVIKPNG
ncbi:MAG: periplasmic-type flagellar collar protein FlbB [Spirochaetia bacterium]